jgi:hypothetical protein
MVVRCDDNVLRLNVNLLLRKLKRPAGRLAFGVTHYLDRTVCPARQGIRRRVIFSLSPPFLPPWA